MAQYVLGPDEDLAVAMRHILDLADDPREVQWVPGTNTVDISDSLADKIAAAQEADAAEAAKPRKRAAKKAAPPPVIVSEEDADA